MATQPNVKVNTTPSAPATATAAQVGAKKYGEKPTPAEVAATIAANGGTISSAIRTLAAGGMTRSEIAHKLQKRYQHVRNVLITPVKAVAAPAQVAQPAVETAKK
jgi:hypothetical protein